MEDLSRQSATGLTKPGPGAGRRMRTSATTATTRCCTSSTTKTPPGQPAIPAGSHRNRRHRQRRLLRHPQVRRPERQAAERVVDRRARGIHRAPGLARRLRRLVHGRCAGRADQRSRGVDQDGAADHLRRERRLLRPRRGPYPNVGDLAGKSTVPLDNELFNGTAGANPNGAPTNGVVGPYGLGVRVPMLVVSPWSTGGWVCSETFDHTSLIRFIEARFGVGEPNITPWRRAVCGDLTSAFDFESASDRVPKVPPVVDTYNTKAAYSSYHPTPPAVASVPTQESGVRPSRRLGYRLHVEFDAAGGKLHLSVKNEGTPRRRAPGAVADGRRRPVQLHGRSRPSDRRRTSRPGHLRPKPPRPEWLLPALRRIRRDGAASRGASRRRSRHADAPPDRSPRSSARWSSKSRTPTAPDSTSEWTEPERSRSTPTIPAAGTTSR